MHLCQVLATHHECPDIVPAQKNALVIECRDAITGAQACLMSMRHGAVW